MNVFATKMAYEKPPFYVLLKQYFFTLGMCFIIATILWLMDSRSTFFGSLVMSICIGSATHIVFVSSMIRFGSLFPLSVFLLFTVPLGAFIGMTLGGLLLGRGLDQIYSEAISTLVITVVATSYFLSHSTIASMRVALQKEEMRRLKHEKLLAETQLKLLQSQIEPHFLFNTLSNVVSLMSVDTPKAEQMLRKLTQFLRVSLHRSRSASASLQDEIDLLNDYLSIFKIRMGDRLIYDWHGIDDACKIEFPPLILQPLVENALIHGLEPKIEGGCISIFVEVTDQLKVTVVDTGLGLTNKSGGSGLGVTNVRERLAMLYGDKADLTLSATEPEGLTVTINMPLVRRA